jgi:micrococcal nuclease
MGWFGWGQNEKGSSWTESVQSKLSEYGIVCAVPDDIFPENLQQIPWNTEHSVLLAVASMVSLAIGVRMGRSSLGFRRKTAVHDISNIGPESPWLKGRVVSVNDGDTFRFYHTPTPFHSSKPGQDEKISDVALPIRICTIDTPETAKFGKPSQPFGIEAKDFLSKLILDRKVNVQLLMKDQYGRAVAQVQAGRFWKRNVDEQMLRKGLAEVYLGSGAVYGAKGKDFYLALQEKATRKKLGIWSDPKRESAAEFKALMKAE